MLGYIKPLKEELKVREYESYKACYCGLCHALKRQFGTMARNLISYDFTFLAMLLWEPEQIPRRAHARCIASPIRKKGIYDSAPVLDYCAAASVILSWWRIKDTIQDERTLRVHRDRMLAILLKSAYNKASRMNVAFKETVVKNLEELNALEQSPGVSVDACADKFARITEALSLYVPTEARLRPLKQVLYHIGRYIYIIDAFDDLDEDIKAQRFNPIAQRYQVTRWPPSEAIKKSIEQTLLNSCALISSAFELLPTTAWTPVLRNIVYLGMPSTIERVLEGTNKIKNGILLEGMEQ